MSHPGAAALGETRGLDEYRLLRQIAVQPRHTVYVAHDRILDRIVLFTAFSTALDASRGAGVRAYARAKHHNLCGIHRIREEGGRAIVVSAFERGTHLDSVSRPLSSDRVAAIGIALSGAIEALHAAGAAHGDVRLERVLLSEDKGPLLFGIEGACPADRGACRKDVHDVLALLRAIAAETLESRLAAIAERAGIETAAELRAALGAL